MARPRQSAKILELNGAFKHNPNRAREDLEGAGPFDDQPPAHLPQELVPSWREIVSQINPIILTASDRSAIELMARLLLQVRLTGDIENIRELRQWFGQYGMTAAGRAKLGTPKRKPSGGNQFADL